MILFALCERVTAEHSTVELQVASTGPETAKKQKDKKCTSKCSLRFIPCKLELIDVKCETVI